MKTMIRVLALALVLVLALGLTACKQDTTDSTDASKNMTNSTEANKDTTNFTEANADQLDWTKYPAKLEDWTMAELKTYLREAGILVDGDNMYALDMSANELEATGVTAGHVYTNTADGSVMDIMMEVRADNLVEELKTAHTVAGVPMDAMVGNFAFSYTGGYDEDHFTAVKKAIEDLGTHYGVTAEIWNK